METIEITTELKNLITLSQAWYYEIVPFKISDGVISFLVGHDKNSADLENELEIVLGKKVKLKGEDGNLVSQANNGM